MGCVTKVRMGVPSWLSGFVCAYYPATPGSSPKYAIYAFIISCKIFAIFLMWKERK